MTPENKQEVLDKLVFDWKAAFAKLMTGKKEQTNKVPKHPNPFIKEVTHLGKVSIVFSSDVFVVPNLQIINNGTIYLDQMTPHRNLRGRINPKFVDSVRIPVLEVNCIPGLESNATDLQFIWNVSHVD